MGESLTFYDSRNGVCGGGGGGGGGSLFFFLNKDPDVFLLFNSVGV